MLSEESRAKILDILKQYASNNNNNNNTTLSLQICSDLHIEFYDDYPSIPQTTLIQPSSPYLCLLGDIGLANDEKYRQFLLDCSDRFQTVFVVAGNHEYYHNTVEKTKNKIREICKERENLVLMDKTSKLYLYLYLFIHISVWRRNIYEWIYSRYDDVLIAT